MGLLTTHAENPRPQLRFLISGTERGYPTLSNILRKHEDCEVARELITGKDEVEGEHRHPDYTIFTDSDNHKVMKLAVSSRKRFLINEERLCVKSYALNRSHPLCDPLPNEDSYIHTKPAIIIHDPVHLFHCSKSQRLGPFVLRQKKLLIMATEGKNVHQVVLERLIRQPQAELRRLFEWWNIPFTAAMVPTSYRALGTRYYALAPPIHSKLVQFPGRSSPELLMSIDEILGRQYLSLWGPHLRRIQANLRSKTWVAFELDNTLHSLSKAVHQAMENVYNAIVAEFEVVTSDKVKEAYLQTVVDYAEEVFFPLTDHVRTLIEKILRKLGVRFHEDYPDMVMSIYARTLKEQVQLRFGVADLLTILNRRGKKLVVVSKAPDEVTQWLLTQLGLKDKILAAISLDGVVSDIMEYMLKELDCSAGELVYVGEKDQVELAMQAGVSMIVFDEKEPVCLDEVVAGFVCVNTMKKVGFLFETGAIEVDNGDGDEGIAGPYAAGTYRFQ